MIRLSDYEELNVYDTLKNTSLNKKNKDVKVYMTDSKLKVIDFDKVKTKYAGRFHLEQLPASSDALLQNDDKIIFIEFKDGNMQSEHHKVTRKIFESLLMFCDITNQTISDTRQYMIFILVYNGQNSKEFVDKCIAKRCERENDTINESASFSKIGSMLGKFAKRNADIFGLRGRFAGIYFKDVLTIEKEDFSEKIFQ